MIKQAYRPSGIIGQRRLAWGSPSRLFVIRWWRDWYRAASVRCVYLRTTEWLTGFSIAHSLWLLSASCLPFSLPANLNCVSSWIIDILSALQFLLTWYSSVWFPWFFYPLCVCHFLCSICRVIEKLGWWLNIFFSFLEKKKGKTQRSCEIKVVKTLFLQWSHQVFSCLVQPIIRWWCSYIIFRIIIIFCIYSKCIGKRRKINPDILQYPTHTAR